MTWGGFCHSKSSIQLHRDKDIKSRTVTNSLVLFWWGSGNVIKEFCACATVGVCCCMSKYMSLLAEHTEEQICETSSSSCLHSSGEIEREWFLSQCDWWHLLAAAAAERMSCWNGGRKPRLPEQSLLKWQDKQGQCFHSQSSQPSDTLLSSTSHLLWHPLTLSAFHVCLLIAPP